MKIKFLKSSRRKLDGIYDWYKEQGAGMAGRKIRAAVLKKAMRLRANPYLGQIEFTLEELGQGHRYLVEGHYKIIYFIDTANQLVVITNIFDTRQDPSKLKS